jgi:dolichyl-phosphate-mannose--protein O-mannosyl transferase
VYALMNPAMVAVIDVLMCLFVGSAMYAIRHRKRVRVQQATVEQLQRGCVLLFGWMGSMLPTMVVYRSGPIYQYLPGLFFAQALGALTFDMLAPRGKTQRYLVALVCLLLVMAFVHWSPWVYARELTPKEHTSRRWLPAWD